MKKSTKLFAIALSATLAATSVAALASCGNAKKTVAIMQFGTHESLNNCYDGIMEALKAQGITDTDYNFEYVNDNFDTTLSASHASKYANGGADIILSIATPSAIAAAEAVKGQIPVVYCAITDDSVMSSYNNVCGSSDRPNYISTLEMMTQFMGKDDLKIGVLSATSESSDAVMIKDLETAAKAYEGMSVDVKYISEISTIGTVTSSLISDGVDCFLNLLDSTVVGQLSTILSVADAANVPVFGSEVEQVVNGCVAASSIDYIEIGKIAGNMAADILKGTKTAKDEGSKVISAPTPYYNPTKVAKFGLTVPTTLEGLISINDYTK